LDQISWGQRWSRGGGGLKILGENKHPTPTFRAYGYHTFPVICVNITIECVNVTVKAQAQKVDQKVGKLLEALEKKSQSAGGRKGVRMDPKIQQFYYTKAVVPSLRHP